jgi:hypothetical protein
MWRPLTNLPKSALQIVKLHKFKLRMWRLIDTTANANEEAIPVYSLYPLFISLSLYVHVCACVDNYWPLVDSCCRRSKLVYVGGFVPDSLSLFFFSFFHTHPRSHKRYTHTNTISERRQNICSNKKDEGPLDVGLLVTSFVLGLQRLRKLVKRQGIVERIFSFKIKAISTSDYLLYGTCAISTVSGVTYISLSSTDKGLGMRTLILLRIATEL